MKDLLTKFEKLFNRLFYLTLEKVDKFIPKKVFKLLESCKFLLKNFGTKLWVFLNGLKQSLIEKKRVLDKKTKKYRSGSFYKEKFNTIKNNPKAFLEKITKLLKELEVKLKKINPTLFVLGGLSLAVVIISSYSIYESSQSIIEKQDLTGEKKILPSAKAQKKPYYYGYKDRLSLITQLTLPIFIEDIDVYRNIKIDFSIEFTNRTSRNFYEKNYHYFMDQLQTTLEPSLASFQLEESGKIILRRKILEELNAVLINQAVDGRVKRVTIIDMLAN
jgi:hypothetical protein